MSDRQVSEYRRRAGIRTASVRPHTAAETAFIRTFANAVMHATAVVAAEPQMPAAAGSLAERVQKAFTQFRPRRHGEIQKRARARLSGPLEQRQRSFGVYADRGRDAWTTADAGLDRDLKRKLRDAVRARLGFEREEIAEKLAVAVAADVSHGAYPPANTTLEVGFFSGDVQAGWTTQTVHSPIALQFRWQTDAPAAERGVWQLFRSGLTFQQEALLASGKAGDAPGAVFTIDLADYLSPNPPTVPAVYRVRVTPGTKPKTMQGASGQVLPIPGKAVAKPSNDVVITYSSGPPLPVEFQIFEIYQTAWFELETIHMVQDQMGPGAEEFHVAGFVQERFPAGSTETGGQDTFGPFYAQLDPDGPRTRKLPHHSSFYLNKPNTPEWPRAFIAVISVLEQDDGGSLNEWQGNLWNIAEAVSSGEIGQAVSEFLEEEFKQYIGDNIGQLIQTGGQIAQLIASLVSSTAGAIAGLVVAAASIVIADIISGMGDDYYGTEVSVLVLPTNVTDFIRSLPGQALPGNGFRLDSESLEFKGYTSWPEASAWDGLIRISFHWEFSDIGLA